MIGLIALLIASQATVNLDSPPSLGNEWDRLAVNRQVSLNQSQAGRCFLFFERGERDFHLLELEFTIENGVVSKVRTLQQLSYGRRPIRFYISKGGLQVFLDYSTKEVWKNKRLLSGVRFEIERADDPTNPTTPPKIMLVPYTKKALVKGYLAYFLVSETWKASILVRIGLP